MSFPDKPITHLLGSNGPINAVAYSASPGTYILTGSSDRSIRLYNPQPNTSIHASSPSSIHTESQPPAPIPQGRLIQTYSAHGYEVLALSVSQDNARFASAGGDRAVFLWDVTTARTIRRFGGTDASTTSLGGHTARINTVCFAGSFSSDADGENSDSLLVSGSLDATVRIWDLRNNSNNNRPVQTLTEARDSISAVVVHGPEIVAASVDGRVRGYDARMGRCVTDVISGTAAVTSLQLSRDGKTMLVGSLDSKIRLMDREMGTCLRTYGATGETMAADEFVNEELRIQSVLGGKEQFVLVGDEMKKATGTGLGGNNTTGGAGSSTGDGRLWAWDVLTGEVRAKIRVPWGPLGVEPKRKLIGRNGKEKERSNVISCMAWRGDGFGDQYCVGGTSGMATVYGYH